MMRRHGVTVIGTSVQDCVFRCVFSARNADYQVRALGIGTISALTHGETELCGKISQNTTGLGRSWEYWSVRLGRAGLMIPPAKAAAKGRRAAARKSARTAARVPARKKTRRR